MPDDQRPRREWRFVKRYEYLTVYIAIVTTITLIVALVDWSLS